MKKNPVSMTWRPPPYWYAPGLTVSLGDDVAPPPSSSPPFSLRGALTSEPVKTASAIALTYHGYRRTGSIVWALIYGLAGRLVPVAAVPISLAQGYGQKKSCP
jgi:hypothetical protein